ncbi:MAG TPA: metallophosphoesterase [Limnochordia bacterium]|jgi:Predicted phosphohydrolase|nr:metallophosphoesterase [Limnochordia bacterium]
MKIFAIGDLHLPGGQEKPMDIFGANWANHGERIAQGWRERVSPGDIVLLPGDLSWAMTLEEAADDLAYLGSLPGEVILIRGNHDYWWSAIGKVRKALPPGVHALQNDYYALGKLAICGTRGWLLPGTEGFGPHDEKVYRREVERLRLSLEAAVKAGLKPAIAMMHYPPAPRTQAPTGFTELLEAYGVQLCVYGHLHGEAQNGALSGTVRGVHYRLVACDAIGFAPLRVAEVKDGELILAP